VGYVADAWRGQLWVRHTAKVFLAAAAAFVIANQLNAGRDDPWAPAGSVAEVRAEEVVYLAEHGVFVVAGGDTFLGLLDDPDHLDGERVLYCRSSGWFEAPTHGEKFDGRGIYADGPAASDIDLVAVRVEDGEVLVNPGVVTARTDRGSEPFEDPDGPFCAGPEGPPGFWAS